MGEADKTLKCNSLPFSLNTSHTYSVEQHGNGHHVDQQHNESCLFFTVAQTEEFSNFRFLFFSFLSNPTYHSVSLTEICKME